MFMVKRILILALLFAGLLWGNAQERVRAVRFATPPVIDGMAREAAWDACRPVTQFIQREPDKGEPFTEPTEVFIGYDRENLYIAFRCYGDPQRITAKEMARDVNLGNDDRVQVILDTYLDRRNAFWFQVGPRGSIGDAIVSGNGAGLNKAWDGLWTGKASIHPEGWDAEMAIPFKTLGFKKGADTWGLKLIRNYMRNQETGYWPVANLNSHRFQVSDAGFLEGLEGISQGVGLDLVPYGLTGADYQRVTGETEPVLNAGLEAYYSITSNLKAALTLNTDFAQTEVDDREINLTRFGLFYPEKRDFFLDGSNYFDFGINGDADNPWNTRLIPFFSRRIGLDSAGNPIPVLFGTKVSGQAGQWNLGAMYMKDQRKAWENSHFAVARISRNFGDQSQAGLITTYGNAQEDVMNYLLGGDVRLGTSQFRKDKNIALSLYGLKSFTAFEDESRSDAGREFAWGIEFAYPNDLVNMRMGHMQVQENFVAGTGFVPRPGVRESYGELLFGPRPGRWGILQVQGGTGLDHISGFSGRLLTREWNLTPLHLRFLSGEEIGYRIYDTYEYLTEPFPIYQDYIIPPGSYDFLYHTLFLHTAVRRRIWGALDYRFGGFYNGSRKEVQLKAGCQVIVPLFLGGELVRNEVSSSDGGFIATIYRLNLNILFTPDITLYNFVQYDSQSGRLGLQSRFQWIIKPGREIFLVWNSIAQDPYERFQLEEASARLKVKFTLRF
jgi:hypothetical protein